MIYKVNHSEKAQYITKISFEISISFMLILYNAPNAKFATAPILHFSLAKKNVNMTGR
jgi:hypothetical protein